MEARDTLVLMINFGSFVVSLIALVVTLILALNHKKK